MAENLDAVLGEMADLIDHAAGCPTPSLYRYVLDHGATHRPALLPPGMSRAPARQCFHNALRLCLREPSLRYVEGYGLLDGLPLPLHHGWAVTDDGTVVDPTWESPEACQYRGVVVPLEFILEWGEVGVLEELAYRHELEGRAP